MLCIREGRAPARPEMDAGGPQSSATGDARGRDAVLCDRRCTREGRSSSATEDARGRVALVATAAHGRNGRAGAHPSRSGGWGQPPSLHAFHGNAPVAGFSLQNHQMTKSPNAIANRKIVNRKFHPLPSTNYHLPSTNYQLNTIPYTITHECIHWLTATKRDTLLPCANFTGTSEMDIA